MVRLPKPTAKEGDMKIYDVYFMNPKTDDTVIWNVLAASKADAIDLAEKYASKSSVTLLLTHVDEGR